MVEPTHLKNYERQIPSWFIPKVRGLNKKMFGNHDLVMGFQRFKVPVSNAKVLGQVLRQVWPFWSGEKPMIPCEKKKGSGKFNDAHPNTKWRAGRQAPKRETHVTGEVDGNLVGGFSLSNTRCFQQVLSHVAGSRSCCKKYPGDPRCLFIAGCLPKIHLGHVLMGCRFLRCPANSEVNWCQGTW